MSLNYLINEQIKRTLNNNTSSVIQSISDNLNISKVVLIEAWNNINNEFKIKQVPEIIDEDIPITVEIIDEIIYPETRIEITDEEL